MDRIPEPDLMNDAAQAQAYALADFSEPHNQFVGQFRRCFPRSRPTRVLDLGCGTADVTLRFARAYSECCMVGIDGAPAMLRHARGAVAGAGMDGRIQLMCVRLPQVREPSPLLFPPGRRKTSAPVRRGKGPLDLFLFRLTSQGEKGRRKPSPLALSQRERGSWWESIINLGFDSIISNSLLHHLQDSAILWDALKSYGRTGTHVLIMDLLRPATRRAAAQLVTTYAGGEHELLKQDFYNSLLAAYTEEEIKIQLKMARLSKLKIQRVSDRHIIVYGDLP